MKVLLVGNYVSDGQESMQRFADLMERGLSLAGHHVRVLRPPFLVGHFYSAGRMLGKWLGYIDKFALFPSILARSAHWADVVHICDHSNAMYTSHVGTRPVVVTCHDMLAVRGALGEDTDCPASRTGKILQRWIVAGLRRAGRVACVSAATSEDVERIVRPGHEFLQVIHNGLNYPYSVLPHNTVKDRLSEIPSLGQRRFLLHVGSNLRRKNREAVIRVFARVLRSIDVDLVLAGPELSPSLDSLARQLGVSSKVIVITKPTNQVLEALYNSALALIFPSRFEGFGWPLAEAQACGCPVVCSRCPPFKEIVADAALTRDVDDEEGFADALVGLARNGEERERLRLSGLDNARRFRPDQMIAAYISLYQDLTHSRRSSQV
jgi:glycosyltransferase involved in cell wall biosynthesis